MKLHFISRFFLLLVLGFALNIAPNDPASAQGLRNLIDKTVKDATSKKKKKTAPQAAPAAAATKSSPVLDIQTALITLGFSVGAADGLWGAQSKAAVAAFQTAQGYPATGDLTEGETYVLFAAEAQLETPEAITKPQFSFAQHALNELGFPAGTVDGLWGSKSQAALDQFRNDGDTAPLAVVDLSALHSDLFPQATSPRFFAHPPAQTPGPVVKPPVIAQAPASPARDTAPVVTEPSLHTQKTDRAALRAEMLRQRQSEQTKPLSTEPDVYSRKAFAVFYNFQSTDDLNDFGGLSHMVAERMTKLRGKAFLVDTVSGYSYSSNPPTPKMLSPDYAISFEDGLVWLYAPDGKHRGERTTFTQSSVIETITLDCFKFKQHLTITHSDWPGGYCFTITAAMGQRAQRYLASYNRRLRRGILHAGVVAALKEVDQNELSEFVATLNAEGQAKQDALAVSQANGAPLPDLSALEINNSVRHYFESTYDGTAPLQANLVGNSYDTMVHRAANSAMFLMYHSLLGNNCDLSALDTVQHYVEITKYEGTTTSYSPWINRSVIRTKTSHYSKDTVPDILIQRYAYDAYQEQDDAALAAIVEIAMKRANGNSLLVPLTYGDATTELEVFVHAMKGIFDQEGCDGPSFHKLGAGFERVVALSR